MSQKSRKVVPIQPQEPISIVARDSQTDRTILAIGRKRFALDICTRVTELPPGTGDKPALVRTLDKPKRPVRPKHGSILAAASRRRPG